MRVIRMTLMVAVCGRIRFGTTVQSLVSRASSVLLICLLFLDFVCWELTDVPAALIDQRLNGEVTMWIN